MATIFLHTADWQLGKPFAGAEDGAKRVLLQQERLNALGRIKAAAHANHAEFIVVAGDLFDSPSATKSLVSAACSATSGASSRVARTRRAIFISRSYPFP